MRATLGSLTTCLDAYIRWKHSSRLNLDRLKLVGCEAFSNMSVACVVVSVNPGVYRWISAGLKPFKSHLTFLR